MVAVVHQEVRSVEVLHLAEVALLVEVAAVVEAEAEETNQNQIRL